jgi:hypothetical protein
MSDSNGRVQREARLRWVPIAKMQVSPVSQRELNRARVDRMVVDFDLEQLGTPTVNLRDGWYYIIDGQHRIEALRELGWEDQQVQCWTYEGLTEQDEAEKFLKLNDTLAVNAFYKFRIGVEAGRPLECDIDRIVRSLNLRVSLDKLDGAIGAVGTLRRVYMRGGPKTLRRTLRIVRDAYGDPGLEAAVIDGVGLFCQRYAEQIEDDAVVARLSSAHGGPNGLLGKAENIRRQTGNQKGQCVAAAVVEVINAGRGGKKLPTWWNSDVAELRSVS